MTSDEQSSGEIQGKAMQQQKFIIVYFFLIIAGLIVLFSLYRETHPMGGVYLPLNKVEIEGKAAQVVRNLGIESEGFYLDAVFTRNPELIRQTQMEKGIAAANADFRQHIPGFYWSVKWLEKDIFINLLVKKDRDLPEAQIDMLKKMRLHLDVHGNVILYQRDIPDTTELPSISRDRAKKIAGDFLQNFTAFSDAFRDTLAADASFQSTTDHSEQPAFAVNARSRDSGRTDYEFSSTQPIEGFSEHQQVNIHVAGNMITNFQAKIEVPEKYRSSGVSLDQFVFPALLMIILITTIIIAFRRWRAYEMDFRFGIGIGIIGGIFFGTYLYFILYRNLGVQVILPVTLNSIFTGGSLVFIWAVAESLGREIWKEKFVPIDLLRNRYFLNSRIGKSLISGIAYGIVMLAAGAVLTKIAEIFQPIAFIPGYDAGRSMFSSSTPLLRMFSQISFIPIWTIAAYVVLAFSLLRKFIPSALAAMILISSLVSLAHRGGIEPFFTGFLIETLMFMVPLWVFYRYNILACFTAIMTGFTLHYGLGLFFTGNHAFTLTGYGMMFGFLLILFYAVATLLARDRISNFDRLAPSYFKNITERERLQKELEIAREVQMSFLPRANPEFTTLDIASRCLPALEVGGDYYDFVQLGGNRLGVVIGDVSGKGTQAAFYMTLTKGFLRALANMSDSPSFILTQLNRLFYDNVKRGVFISMIYGIFDMEDGTLSMARAGHNPVVMRKPSEQELQMIHPKGLALGMEKGDAFERLIQEVKIPLHPNDLFVFYTDGFPEAMNKEKEEFGDDRFEESIEKHSGGTAEEILQGVFQDVKLFAGKAEQHDDMTMVVVKIAESKNDKMSLGAITRQLQEAKN